MQMRKGGWRLGMAAAVLLLSGCDQLGLETPAKAAEREIAEAKAIGGACRHALRAIEDCYTLNPKSDKSSVFTGWREMDEYMRENKLDGIAPVVPRPAATGPSKPRAKHSEADDEEAEEEEVANEAPTRSPTSGGNVAGDKAGVQASAGKGPASGDGGPADAALASAADKSAPAARKKAAANGERVPASAPASR